MPEWLFVLAIIFLAVVAPLWILMHYLTGKRRSASSAKELAADDRAELERLAQSEAAMRERIATLESILDEETPHWRRKAD